MENNSSKFTQNDSPTGEFLQSEVWRKFQESVGRKTFHLEGENFWANIISHTLPIVGEYFYVPRGPKISDQESVNSEQEIEKLINLAKENNVGWIRIDPESEEILENIRKNTKHKIIKAPHDMQPREIFVIDITKSEEDILAEMKAKTRYNIRLAEKKKVIVRVISNSPNYLISNQTPNPKSQTKSLSDQKKYVDEFLRLTAVMAKRNGITTHTENYYRKMFKIIPGDILKLYIAEYDGKVIVANLVIFFGETCMYLHGASDDSSRNVMAPYLLQWQQIQDAKKAGCVWYDFGGVASAISNFQFPISNQIQNPNYKNIKHIMQNTNWQGITKFKLGFSPKTLPTVFPGSYDVVISPVKYQLYRVIQKVKAGLS